MLQCWEIDLDERPEFDQLAYLLGDLSQQGNVSQQITNIFGQTSLGRQWVSEKHTPAKFRSCTCLHNSDPGSFDSHRCHQFFQYFIAIDP